MAARKSQQDDRSKPGSTSSRSIRLQKVLAEAGIASRRRSEEIIQDGRVTVDGVIVRELGVKVDPQSQKIVVDGQPIHSERKAYYIVNKPVGYLSTNDDPAGRDRVIDLLPKTRERLFPVGRLDEASQGLMLVTNDGALANRLLHPRFGIPKVYRVQVAGYPEKTALDTLRSGQEFAEGTFRVDSVKITRTQGDSTFLEIVLKEGHNREIRRLLARIGHKVLQLKRIAFGPLRIGRLQSGECRHLTQFEIKQLKQAAAGQTVVGEAPLDPDAGTGRQRSPARRSSTPPAARTHAKATHPTSPMIDEPTDKSSRTNPKSTPRKPHP